MAVFSSFPGAAAISLSALLLCSAAALQGQMEGSGSYQPRFEPEDRDQWQMPDSVVAALGLKEGEVVADIGAASGYFSRRFSPAVGRSGRVLAVDIDTEALGYLAVRAHDKNLANLDTVHAAPDNPHLPESRVDLIFMCNTLHHLPARVKYLAALQAALKSGGRIAVVDFFKKDLPVGPRELAHKLSGEEAKNAFTEAGYRITKEFKFLPYQYFFVAEPLAGK